MKQVHVTTLTKYNKCPADYMYSQSQPELKNTYKGDILNTAVLSMGPLGPRVKFYANNIDSDFAELEKLKKVILEARAYAAITRAKVEALVIQGNKDVGYYQETKMVIPYNSEYTIVGSVDFLYNVGDGWVIEDFKYSTHNWYSDEEILKYDCQRVVYALMVMNYFGIDNVLFRFNVWDKSKTTQKYCGEMKMERKYCEDYMKDVMERFISAEEMGFYPECKSHKCFYCGPKMRSGGGSNDDFVF